jgi:hypothetical protein
MVLDKLGIGSILITVQRSSNGGNDNGRPAQIAGRTCWVIARNDGRYPARFWLGTLPTGGFHSPRFRAIQA